VAGHRELLATEITPSGTFAVQRSAGWWCALSLVLTPVLIVFGAIKWLGVNTLIGDEFYYVDFIRLVRDGGEWASWIWLQHNEHRVVPMKLLMVLLQGSTRWSQLAEMFCSGSLSALIVVVLWRAYRLGGGTSSTSDLLAFAPIAWLVSSLSQYENQFFGMMVCHYFAALGTVVALWLLARGGEISTVLAWLAAAVAAFSIGSGFLVFPAGMAVLAAQRATWRRWGIWCLGGLAALVWYLSDYITPPHTQPFYWTVENISAILTLGLTTIGAPLAAGSVEWAGVAAIGLLITSAILFLRWLPAHRRVQERDALAVGLLLFGLASAVMVGVGRAGMHGHPLESRYITYTNLAWIGAYLLVLQHVRIGGEGRWKVAAWSVLVPGLLAASVHGLGQARLRHKQLLLDQYVLQTFYFHSDSVVGRLGPPAGVRQKAAYLMAEGLSAFAEPQRLVMMMNPAEARVSAEILIGQQVEQRLACPVADLHDVGVMVLPALRPGTSAFVVTVTIGSRTVARQSVESASIRARTWVRVPLPTPFLECAGSALVVRVESQTVDSGSGVFVLASEPSYQGALSQAGTPILGRRLGIALNGFHYGILP
jgi:hypothetical protein